MNTIRVGIVDDKPKLLNSLKENLSLFPDVHIIWMANDGEEAFNHARTDKADIILMDIEMPKMDGIQATEKIKSACPEVKIIMLTIFDNNDKIFEAILAGASGYMLKDSPPAKIYQAMMEVQEGGAPMSPIIASKALQLINNMHKQETVTEHPVPAHLSQREMEILQHLTAGLNYQVIAEKLFISPKTVRNHIQNIYQKLQVSSKAEVIHLSHKNNWFKR